MSSRKAHNNWGKKIKMSTLELFFLGRCQTSSSIELEENNVSIFYDVISTLLSILACRLERERRKEGREGGGREEGRKSRREGGREGEREGGREEGRSLKPINICGIFLINQ